VRLLCPIFDTAFYNVDGPVNQLSICDIIAAQLVCHDLPGFPDMAPSYTIEEALGCSAVTSYLQVYINRLTVLIYCTPKVVLLAIDPSRYFIDVKNVAVSSVRPRQSSSVNLSEFDTPQSDGLSTNSDASLCQKIFYIQVTEVEAIVEPDGVGNAIWR